MPPANILTPRQYSHPSPIFSPPALPFSPPALVEVRGRDSEHNSHPPHLWGGVRGRDSELAGGVINKRRVS